MSKPLIVIGSITHAMKAREALSKNKINSEIIKNPRKTKSGSCNYGLHVASGDVNKAKRILHDNNIKILEITEKR